MDTGHSTALASLRADLRRVESTLGTRIHQIDGRLESGGLSISSDIRQIEAHVIRHIDVVAEALRDDIRVIVQRLSALEARIESLQELEDPLQCGESEYDVVRE